MRTYGRKTIYVNMTEKQLLSSSLEKQQELILSVLPYVISIHEKNKAETEYLWNYYLGIQDILQKVKYTRDEINNKEVENWAYAIIDFKKAWILGKPIQYVMLNSSSSEEIEVLNKYARYEGKEAKDQLLYEDILAVGRGFRYTNSDKINEDDEAPFEILNIDRDCCEVVYSNRLGHEQLFSIIETPMIEPVLNPDTKEYEDRPYKEYTIYTRNRMFIMQFKGYNSNPFTFVDSKPIALKEHLITEWNINRDRISLIEIGKDLFDSINKLESLDADDMEQFVNAIMVFTNAEVDENELTEIKRLGAVNIKSTENKKASIDLLQARMKASDTQVMYTRLLVALFQILGVPMATDSGSVSSGETGKAKLTGQGYTSAGIRAQTDEVMLRECDYKGLRTILKICKKNPKSEIETLKVSDVDIKFNIDMSDNLLVKTQGLLNLLNADIPREFALPIVNLFSDPTAVVKKIEDLFGEQTSQMGANKDSESPTGQNINNNSLKDNNANNIENNAQTNNIVSTSQNNLQGK